MSGIRSLAEGPQYGAKVDSENRLHVFAVQEPVIRHINAKSGKVWSIPFDGLDPTGNDDYVVYVKNTGTPDLFISHIRLSADTATTEIQIHSVTGVAGGSLTDITPISRTVGSSATPSAEIKSSSDITGLTTAGTHFYMELAVANTMYTLIIDSNIIIPKDQAVAILVQTGTANLTGVITLSEGENL